jgi:hypothetical protein
MLYEDDGGLPLRGLARPERRVPPRGVEGRCLWKQGQPDALPMVVDDILADPSLDELARPLPPGGHRLAGLRADPDREGRDREADALRLQARHDHRRARAGGAQRGRRPGQALVARLRMAEALSTNERRFRSMVEGSEVIVWEFDVLRDASPTSRRRPRAWASRSRPGWPRASGPRTCIPRTASAPSPTA